MITKTIKNRPGAEVVAICTKCKIALAHTIVAMDGVKIKKVRCRTCGSEHRFVSNEPKPRTIRLKAKPEEIWEQLMKTSREKKKFPYTPAGRYKENDVIDHTFFGIGIVAQVFSGDKIRVIFKVGEKFLASGR